MHFFGIFTFLINLSLADSVLSIVLELSDAFESFITDLSPFISIVPLAISQDCCTETVRDVVGGFDLDVTEAVDFDLGFHRIW